MLVKYEKLEDILSDHHFSSFLMKYNSEFLNAKHRVANSSEVTGEGEWVVILSYETHKKIGVNISNEF